MPVQTRSQIAAMAEPTTDKPDPDVLDKLPHYTIDLSCPPRERYLDICRDFKQQLHSLQVLFDEILAPTPYPRLLHFLAKRLLTRVKCAEESEEIQGIAKAVGVGLHLVVAYNTFLDLFSGCVSGAVNARADADRPRMLHFRGLDWEMEPLRKLIISVDYLRDSKVIARGITYAGYTGALTVVREGLSMSFNYRARIDSSASTTSHRIHQLLLLLGYRTSTPSLLRRIILAPDHPPTLAELETTIPSMICSPGYVTFCSPESALIIEKDLKTAVTHSSSDFLSVTNHDLKVESWDPKTWEEALQNEPDVAGIQNLLSDSIERKECVAQMYGAATKRGRRPKLADLVKWVTTKPILNETTHFSCIMDPAKGEILWTRAYATPVKMDPPSSDEESSYLY